MQHDRVQLGELAPQERRHLLGDVLVGGAVEPVPAHVVLLGELGVDRIGGRGRG
jgi:hypothetical protein